MLITILVLHSATPEQWKAAVDEVEHVFPATIAECCGCSAPEIEWRIHQTQRPSLIVEVGGIQSLRCAEHGNTMRVREMLVRLGDCFQRHIPSEEASMIDMDLGCTLAFKTQGDPTWY